MTLSAKLVGCVSAVVIIIVCLLTPLDSLPISADQRLVDITATPLGAVSSDVQVFLPHIERQPSKSAATPALTPTTALATLTSTPSSTPSASIATVTPTLPLPPSPTLVLTGQMELIGQIGGTSKTVEVQGQYAYVGVGLRLTVLDLANPTQPREVGGVRLPYPVEVLEVAGPYAYTAGHAHNPEGTAEMHVIDISDATAPRVRGSYTFHPCPDGASFCAPLIGSIFAASDYVYVAAGRAGFFVLDVANPAAPHQVAVIDNLGPYDWNPTDFYLVGRQAYVISGSVLHTLDLTDLAAPRRLGGYATSPPMLGVVVAGSYAYVVGDEFGLIVLNVSDPASPRPVNATPLRWYPSEVWIDGSRLYVADGAPAWNSQIPTGGLRVFDLTNPQAPHQMSHFALPFTFDAAMDGDTVVLAAWYEGIRIVDVSAPDTVRLMGVYSLPGLTNAAHIVGKLAYVADSDFMILDVSNPAAPQVVSALETPGFAQTVFVAGHYAYVGESEGRLRIIDVRDPTRPQEVGVFDLRYFEITSVVVADRYAYIGSGHRYFNAPTVYVIDVADPSMPRQVGEVWGGDMTRSLVLVGQQLYVADERRGMRILDLADPAAPRVIGHYDTVRDMAVADTMLYATTTQRGLRIVDVSNPAQPQEVGVHLDWDAGYEQLATTGGFLVIYDVWGNGFNLKVMDVRDPTAPRVVQRYLRPESVRDITIEGKYVYMSMLHIGLLIYRLE